MTQNKPNQHPERKLYAFEQPALNSLTKKVLLYDKFIQGATPHKTYQDFKGMDWGEITEPAQLATQLQERYIVLYQKIVEEIADGCLQRAFSKFSPSSHRSFPTGLDVRARVALRRMLDKAIDGAKIQQQTLARLKTEVLEGGSNIVAQTTQNDAIMLLVDGSR